jgi:predicted acyltransferase (DUF342 family)
MKLIKKHLVTAILASTFSLGAHAVGINFDGGAKGPHSPVGANCTLYPNTTAPGGTYECSAAVSSDKDDVYIASHYLVTMTGTVETLSAASAILGANGSLAGNLNSASTVALGANAEITGNVTSVTTVALGAGAKVTKKVGGPAGTVCGVIIELLGTDEPLDLTAHFSVPNGDDGDTHINAGTYYIEEACTINAGTTLALGAGAKVTGNVKAATTIAVGANGSVEGTMYAGTTVALGAQSSVTGAVTAGTTVVLGAESYVDGDVISLRSTVTLGVDAYVLGTTKALKAEVTLGAGAYACKDVAAYSAATLGVNSIVRGDLEAVTSTVAAGAFLTGNVSGTTATMGADSCYGSITVSPTITHGANSGYCNTYISSGSRGDKSSGVEYVNDDAITDANNKCGT